jgi:hypothetical protein
MTIRHILLILTLFIALRAEGAMVRVTAIENSRTLIVERNGKPERVTLAGVAITDDPSARALLEWTLVSRWVSLEEMAGGHFVYRSPDALFVNRELVLRRFARATLPGIEPVSHVPVTYLGTLDLPAPSPAPTVKSASGSRTDNAPSVRRSTSRSRRPGRRR